jgi:hypothetical protein
VPDEEKTRGVRPLLRGLQTGQRLLLGAGAAAGALLSVLGLVAAFHHSGAPARAPRSLSIDRISPPQLDVTRRTYCAAQRPEVRRACLSNGSPTDLGDQYDVALYVTGYPTNKACCQLRYTLFEVDKLGHLLDTVPRFRRVVAVDQIVPRDDLGDHRTFEAWIPYVKTGRFRLEFEAFDADGQTDAKQTKPFNLS